MFIDIEVCIVYVCVPIQNKNLKKRHLVEILFNEKQMSSFNLKMK